jgi:beta-glucanase (GH16 family)
MERPIVISENEGKLLIGVTFEEFLAIECGLGTKVKGIRFNNDLILVNMDHYLANELADSSCSNSKLEYSGTISFNMRSICNNRAIHLSKLGDYEMNDAKTTLTATLTVEKAAEVLGMTLNATSDVVITVSTNGTYLTRVSIEYTKGEASVRIDTSYS